MPVDLQAECERGQQQLMRMEYLLAEQTLAEAEQQAWQARDFDTLARLYMPLQEARRQRRQRCAEGVVKLDLIAAGPGDLIDAAQIIQKYPQGQLLIAGWGTIAPALELRRLAKERGLYVETFLAAAYPAGGAGGVVVAIVPSADVALADASPRSVDSLIRRLPPHCITLAMNELSEKDAAFAMSMWQRLHAPFLAAADMQIDPIRKIEAYRKTLDVDYGCELAHQNAADVAHQLARGLRRAQNKSDKAVK